jgi:hypothetical protein
MKIDGGSHASVVLIPRKCDIEDVIYFHIDFGDSHLHDSSVGINNCQVVVSCRRIDLPAPAVQCARRQHE